MRQAWIDNKLNAPGISNKRPKPKLDTECPSPSNPHPPSLRLEAICADIRLSFLRLNLPMWIFLLFLCALVFFNVKHCWHMHMRKHTNFSILTEFSMLLCIFQNTFHVFQLAQFPQYANVQVRQTTVWKTRKVEVHSWCISRAGRGIRATALVKYN